MPTPAEQAIDEIIREDEEIIKKKMAHLEQLRQQAFEIQVEVLEGGKLPSKAHRTDAGFDVYATEDATLHIGDILKQPLNIRMKLPVGSWARIETKSGLGSKGMLVYAGVVDQEYRGVPHVIAANLCQTPIQIKKGDKIAQITMNPHYNEYYIKQVESVDTNTTRGEGGFGSSGR